MNKYIAKPISKKPSKRLSWGGGMIGVFKIADGEEVQIGEYERNYSSLFNTFFPFELNNKELALYSRDYTATRIMELPSCKDLGGEEPSDGGFCPVGYFVPTYLEQEIIWNYQSDEEEITRTCVNNPREEALKERIRENKRTDLTTNAPKESKTLYRPLTPILYHSFGFVAGCIWGDDNTDKVQYLDLSEADKGKLKRDERFGYIELPENLKLEDAIEMDDYDRNDDTANYIRINVMKTFDMRTGKLINP